MYHPGLGRGGYFTQQMLKQKRKKKREEEEISKSCNIHKIKTNKRTES